MITVLSSPGEVSRNDTFQFAVEIGKNQRLLRTGSPHDKRSWHRLSPPGEENDQEVQRQSQNGPQQQDPIQIPREGEARQSTSIRIIPRRRILDDAVEQQELGRVLQESRKEYIKSFLCTTEASSELIVEVQKRAAGVIEESLNSTSQKNDSNICCSICLDEYAPGDLVSRAKKASACNHLFHENCITGWLMNHDDCPCCRTSYFE